MLRRDNFFSTKFIKANRLHSINGKPATALKYWRGKKPLVSYQIKYKIDTFQIVNANFTIESQITLLQQQINLMNS